MHVTKFTAIVSVCESKDIDIWKYVSSEIPDTFNSSTYKVIVPDGQVDLFKRVSNPAYEVIPESNYFGNWYSHFEKKIGEIRPDRRGWYLQQLLKLSAISELDSGETALIWDADTLPLRKIEFVKESGSLNFLKGEEHHLPYFKNISLLTGLSKRSEHSFIAQSFPIYTDWFHSFERYLSKKHGVDWQIAIIDSIDTDEICGFSEYETLGTYVSHYYPNQIQFLQSKWIRYGNRLMGNGPFRKFCLENFWIQKLLFFRYSTITFEHWDQSKLSLYKKAIYWFDLLCCYRPRN